MRRLASDLLDVSALESGHLHTRRDHVPVAVLLGDVRDGFQRIAEVKGIQLTVDTAIGLPSVFADRDRIGQVFGNIVTNALRFTSRGGNVCVRARRSHDTMEFSISDTGCGIAAEDLPLVFDRYWQASGTAPRGNGLGLSIARGIVESHGGKLQASSVLREGSTFSFTLPVAGAATDEP